MIAITGAFAQRHCDVEMAPLIGPANGLNYPCNATVVSGYYLINRGPDVVKSYDSFFIADPNIYNKELGADSNDITTFYYYTGYPTGLALNGVDGDQRAPTFDIPVGDTIIYYQWNDTITRLSTLILADTYAISVDNDTMDYYVFTDTGKVPPNGNYYWLARFLTWRNDGDVVDTVGANNFQFNGITISCNSTGIKDTKYSKIALNVYPNPASNSIYFNYTFDKATLVTTRIMDLTGRTLKTVNLGKASPGNQKFEIDVNELPAGTYLLEFATSDSKGVAKFTKQ